MITDIIAAVTHFITNTIDAWGYPGVAVLMAIESAAIPLPSEIIMPFAGVSVEVGRFTLHGLALAGAIGSVAGSVVTYAIGYYGGRPLVLKYGRYVLITEHDLSLAERFFQGLGKWSLFLGRVLPVIRTFISVPAGIAKVPFWPFVFTSFVGSYIWSYFMAYLGLRLGQNWHSLEQYFRKLDVLIGLVIIVVAVWWIRRHLRK